MVAIVIAVAALMLSVVGLAAIGTIALKLRLVSPRPAHAGGTPEPQEVTLPSAGHPVAAVLGPLIEATIESPDGPVTLMERYLLTDGPVLVASTSCAACRYLIAEAADELKAAKARTLVVAPTIDRGVEFVEQDCGAHGISYQVDPEAERARAFGVSEFPTVLRIADGRVAAAHVVVTRAQLASVLGGPDGRTPVAAAGESKEG